MGKNCALGLEYGPRPYSRPRAQFFPIRTSRPVNNIYVSSPYIACALLNGIIPGDVQGDAALSAIVNMAGSARRCSGICRIKLT